MFPIRDGFKQEQLFLFKNYFIGWNLNNSSYLKQEKINE